MIISTGMKTVLKVPGGNAIARPDIQARQNESKYSLPSVRHAVCLVESIPQALVAHDVVAAINVDRLAGYG